MARRPTIKALTGLINARARAAEADNARARTELDTLRLADTIAQRTASPPYSTGTASSGRCRSSSTDGCFNRRPTPMPTSTTKGTGDGRPPAEMDWTGTDRRDVANRRGGDVHRGRPPRARHQQGRR